MPRTLFFVASVVSTVTSFAMTVRSMSFRLSFSLVLLPAWTSMTPNLEAVNPSMLVSADR